MPYLPRPSTIFDKTEYTLRFNAPGISGESGADIDLVPGMDVPQVPGGMSLPSVKPDQIRLNRQDVLMRKAWFAPDTTYLADWEDNDADTLEGDGSLWEDMWQSAAALRRRSQTSLFGLGREVVNQASYKTPDINVFGDDTKYGFRFMYNPSVLQFSVGLSRGVNTSYIFSGASTAAPVGVTATGSSIGVSFPISRVDDLSVMQAITGQSAMDFVNSAPTVLSEYTTKQIIDMYGSGNSFPKVSIPNIKADNVDTTVRMSDIRGIAARGTMYDLDFLFRTCLGRQWKTYYRGYTADVGLAFSVPLVLYLNPTMIYRVRLASIGYTHKMFTPDMIPTYTEVTLGFERIPDVASYSTIKTNDGGSVTKPSGEVGSQ